jgi:hypothetical protein
MSFSDLPDSLRRRVAEAAGYRCGYCRTPVFLVCAPMEIDHLWPRSRGGLTTEENLWLSCPLCNGRKLDHVRALDLLTGRRVPLFNPRRQDWFRHFAWSEDGLLILGRTATGRATVDLLDLNGPLRVQLRRYWWRADLRPPDWSEPPV